MKCQYSRLEQDALLHISGPDTLKFLQGQTTCDTRNVTSALAAPGAFCTPQGRVICDFLLCQLGAEHFALRMRRGIRAKSSTAFGKYIIFSKAKLDATCEDWSTYAIWGAEAATALREIFGEVPNRRFGSTGTADFVLVQSDDAGHQFECYLRQASCGALLGRIEQLMECGSENDWQALQIAHGIARIEPSTVEEFVPQVLNYDRTGHISFKKGCYTGQEVVARLHYLGKAKRRTYWAHLTPPAACEAGEAVFDIVSGQAAGTIVNCCTVLATTHVLVAATETGITNGLRLASPDGPLLTLGQLPYALESD